MDYQVQVRDNWPKSTRSCWRAASPRIRAWRRPCERLHEYVRDLQDLRPQAVHLRLDQEEGLVVRRREAAPTRCGKSAASSASRTSAATRAFRSASSTRAMRTRRTSTPPADDFLDLNFIAYHSAWPYHARAGRVEGLQAAAQEPVLRSRLDLRGDVSPAGRWSVRMCSARCCATSVPTTCCGAPTRCCGAIRSGRSTPSASSRSPISWSKATAIPRSRPRSAQGVRRECRAHLEHRQAEGHDAGESRDRGNRAAPDGLSALALAGADSSRGRPRLLQSASRRVEVPFYEYACDPCRAHLQDAARDQRAGAGALSQRATARCAK